PSTALTAVTVMGPLGPVKPVTSSGVNVAGSIGLANVTRTLLTRPTAGVLAPGLTAVTVGATATMPSNSRSPGIRRKSSVPELGASGLFRVVQVTVLPVTVARTSIQRLLLLTFWSPGS